MPTPHKTLQFITVTDLSGRQSSIAIHGRRDNGTLTIVGTLQHNAEIEPVTHRDADRLIGWLEEWKKNNPDKAGH